MEFDGCDELSRLNTGFMSHSAMHASTSNIGPISQKSRWDDWCLPLQTMFRFKRGGKAISSTLNYVSTNQSATRRAGDAVSCEWR